MYIYKYIQVESTGSSSSRSSSADISDHSNQLTISILLDDEREDKHDTNKKRKQDDIDQFKHNEKGTYSSKNQKGNKRHEMLTVGALLWFTTTTGCILSSNVLFQYKNDNMKSNNDQFLSEVC
jgi:hypothetical protein